MAAAQPQGNKEQFSSEENERNWYINYVGRTLEISIHYETGPITQVLDTTDATCTSKNRKAESCVQENAQVSVRKYVILF